MPFPWRLWVPVASVVLGVGALTALAGGGVLAWEGALQLGGIFTALLSLGLLLFLLWRVDGLSRRLQRETQRRTSEAADRMRLLQSLQADSAKIADRLEADRANWTKTVGRLGADHQLLLKRLDAVAETVGLVRRTDVPRLMRVQGRLFEAAAEHVTKQGRRDYEQHVAWYQLHTVLKPTRTMPALRGWAASPDVLCLLVEAIRDHSPSLTVECGSGASTVWLGLALRRFGGGRLIALEHDVQYAARSRALVAGHDLSDIVEIRLAPLRPWTSDGTGSSQLWYDLDSVADLVDIDLLFVDGPPLATGPQARYPAGPILFPRCSSRCVVVLDDTSRPDEQAASDRWVEAYPDFQRSKVETEKGADVLIRVPDAAASGRAGQASLSVGVRGGYVDELVAQGGDGKGDEGPR